MWIKAKIVFYKYKAKIYLAISKPFGWVNTVFHSKHVEALRTLQRYEAGFASKK